MGVRKLEQVGPVFFVEACERCQDEDSFSIFDRMGCGREIVELVVYDRRRDSSAVRVRQWLLAES